MITLPDGTIARNLQEQVKKNQDDIYSFSQRMPDGVLATQDYVKANYATKVDFTALAEQVKGKASNDELENLVKVTPTAITSYTYSGFESAINTLILEHDSKPLDTSNPVAFCFLPGSVNNYYYPSLLPISELKQKGVYPKYPTALWLGDDFNVVQEEDYLRVDLEALVYVHYIVLKDTSSSTNAIYLTLYSPYNINVDSLQDLNTLLGSVNKYIACSGFLGAPVTCLWWKGTAAASAAVVNGGSLVGLASITNLAVSDVVELIK